MNNLTLRIYVWMQSLMACEEGQDLIEYALLLSLLAFGAVVGMESLAGGLNNAFDHIVRLLRIYIIGGQGDLGD